MNCNISTGRVAIYRNANCSRGNRDNNNCLYVACSWTVYFVTIMSQDAPFIVLMYLPIKNKNDPLLLLLFFSQGGTLITDQQCDKKNQCLHCVNTDTFVWFIYSLVHILYSFWLGKNFVVWCHRSWDAAQKSGPSTYFVAFSPFFPPVWRLCTEERTCKHSHLSWLI